ncbi:MAG: hypothetical protein H0W67_09840 [Gemmatimonadales bacterium]|nr:hypothetical protein [Gemmatimonadales bacterium]
MEGVLAIIFIFGGGTLFLLSVSPVGKAFAERLRGRTQSEADPELLAEVDALRREVSELSERVDFTERLMLQADDRDRSGKPPLGPGEGAR